MIFSCKKDKDKQMSSVIVLYLDIQLIIFITSFGDFLRKLRSSLLELQLMILENLN